MMMSARWYVFSSLVFAAAFPAVAKVDAVHKTGVADKRPDVVHEQFLGNFENCSVQAEYSLKDGAVKAEVFRRNCWIPDMGRFEPVGNNIRASVRRARTWWLPSAILRRLSSRCSRRWQRRISRCFAMMPSLR